jgi:hypothetical protein
MCCADRAGQVEKQLAACEASLQAERVAHSKLQADATLEHSTAAALRVGIQVKQQTASFYNNHMLSDSAARCSA